MSDQPKRTFTLELTDSQALLVSGFIADGLECTEIGDEGYHAIMGASQALYNQVVRPLTHTTT